MVAPNVSSPPAVQKFSSTKTMDIQMTDATLNLAAAPTYAGTDRLILGIVLAVVTFWLFAQTTLNVASTMRDDLHITNSASNIAVSITALFSGIFIVVAGGLADQFGRVKLTISALP
jgi:DHA2 family multidrug resistance protein-like MFS transporter